MRDAVCCRQEVTTFTFPRLIREATHLLLVVVSKSVFFFHHHEAYPRGWDPIGTKQHSRCRLGEEEVSSPFLKYWKAFLIAKCTRG